MDRSARLREFRSRIIRSVQSFTDPLRSQPDERKSFPWILDSAITLVGLTEVALAESAGVNVSTLRRWINGSSSAGAVTRQAIYTMVVGSIDFELNHILPAPATYQPVIRRARAEPELGSQPSASADAVRRHVESRSRSQSPKERAADLLTFNQQLRKIVDSGRFGSVPIGRTTA